MKNPSNHQLAMADEFFQQRRQLGAISPRIFSQIYLGGHCRVAFSRMHEEMFELLLGMTTKRRVRLAIAAPRGHAKSTIASLAYPLWCLLYGKEKFILIVSNTQDQARVHLVAIKDELQNNPLLLSDFPEICKPLRGSGKPTPWRSSRIKIPNGAMVAAYGVGQGLRGAKSGSERPGLIIVDDLENRESAIYEEQRDKLADWFRKTLLKAVHPESNVVVVGTILHQDSLLANLIDSAKTAGWTGRKYKAIEKFSDHPELWERWSGIYCLRAKFQEEEGPEAAKAFFEANKQEMLEGVRVLWPEWEDYHSLMVTRERDGRRSFQAEKQNEPIDPAQCIFTEDKITYWDKEFSDEQSLIASLGYRCEFFGACDPSLGQRSGEGDYSAIVIACKNRETEIVYILAADIARRGPNETIERIIHYASMYKFKKFGLESNGFQEVMVKNLEDWAWRVNTKLNIVSIANTGNKHSRIANLEPDIAQGRVRFSPYTRLLLEQLEQFPVGKYDDGPDALEMVVRLARKPVYTLRIGKLLA